MHRVGISFRSALSPDEVLAAYIGPLREALEAAGAGIYSNYLRSCIDEDELPEHLLVFQIHDFETGLRLLRMTMEGLGPAPGIAFHNLDASNPMY